MIINSKKTKKYLIKSIKQLQQIISKTIGPNGKNVLINKEYDFFPTNDGYTIAKYLSSNNKNKINETGIRIILDAALKTNDVVGDGTSSTILISTYLCLEVFKCMSKYKDTINIFKGIKNIYDLAIDILFFDRFSIIDYDIIKQIALTSTNNACTETCYLADIIHQAYKEVGYDGKILIEEGNETKLIIKKGLRVKITKTKNILLLNTILLIINDNIDDINKIKDIINYSINKEKNIVLIVNNYDEEIKEILISNKINIILIKLALNISSRYEIYEDISLYTGIEILSKVNNLTEYKEIDYLEINNNELIIYKEEVNDKLNNEILKIKAELKKESITCYDRNVLENRLERIANKIAVIRISGCTDLETEFNKFKLIDSLKSINSSIKHGYVIGGGVEYLNIYLKLINKVKKKSRSYNKGQEIALDSLLVIIKTIMSNSNVKHNKKYLIKIKKNKDIDFGYNGKANCWSNLLKDGIIDSAESLKQALINAYSVTQIITNCNNIIFCKDINDLEFTNI